MYPYFQNKKGQFVVPIWEVVSPHHYGDEHIPQIIKNQPMKEVIRDYWRQEEGYGVLALANASTYLPNNKFCMSEDELMFMLESPLFLEGLKKLQEKFNLPFYNKIVKIKKELKKGNLTLHTFDPLEDFSQKQCVALFCTLKNGSEGFIQRNGSLGTLSKATLFENPQDAVAEIGRRGVYMEYDDIQSVWVNITVSELGPMIKSPAGDPTTDYTNSSIEKVSAFAQRQKIVEALKTASVEQLSKAYEELTGSKWGEETLRSSKKKM